MDEFIKLLDNNLEYINNRIANVGKSTICNLLKKENEIIDKIAVTKVCIDDFDMKKRHIYGTVMVDIETKRIIDLPDSRELDDVVKWLKTYPNLKIVSRYGSLTYAKAIRTAHLNAIQISDRFIC